MISTSSLSAVSTPASGAPESGDVSSVHISNGSDAASSETIDQDGSAPEPDFARHLAANEPPAATVSRADPAHGTLPREKAPPAAETVPLPCCTRFVNFDAPASSSPLGAETQASSFVAAPLDPTGEASGDGSVADAADDAEEPAAAAASDAGPVLPSVALPELQRVELAMLLSVVPVPATLPSVRLAGVEPVSESRDDSAGGETIDGGAGEAQLWTEMGDGARVDGDVNRQPLPAGHWARRELHYGAASVSGWVSAGHGVRAGQPASDVVPGEEPVSADVIPTAETHSPAGTAPRAPWASEDLTPLPPALARLPGAEPTANAPLARVVESEPEGGMMPAMNGLVLDDGTGAAGSGISGAQVFETMRNLPHPRPTIQPRGQVGVEGWGMPVEPGGPAEAILPATARGHAGPEDEEQSGGTSESNRDFSAATGVSFGRWTAGSGSPEGWVEGASLTPAPIQASERIQELARGIVEQSLEFRHRSADSMSVVVRPDSGTELRIELRRLEGRVEIQVVVERGEAAAYQTGWSGLQSELSSRGLRLQELQVVSVASTGEAAITGAVSAQMMGSSTHLPDPRQSASPGSDATPKESAPSFSGGQSQDGPEGRRSSQEWQERAAPGAMTLTESSRPFVARQGSPAGSRSDTPSAGLLETWA